MGQGGRGAQGGRGSQEDLEDPGVEQCGDWTVLPFRGAAVTPN